MTSYLAHDENHEHGAACMSKILAHAP